MKENLLGNLDIIIAVVVTFIATIVIILIPIKIYIKHHYSIALTKTQTMYQKTLNIISEDVDFIRAECTDIYSIKRIKGRNDTQRSAIRRIKLYLDMIKSHIVNWNVNGE